MTGKLMKKDNHYYFWSSNFDSEIGDGFVANTTDDATIKLSIENCKTIENGYDLSELSYSYAIENAIEPSDKEEIHNSKIDFIQGFLKAIEILGDKNYNRQDVIHALTYGVRESKLGKNHSQILEEYKDTHLNSLDEWNDIEVEMEYIGECNGNDDNGCFQDSPGHNCGCFERKPKLDSNGFLILKIKK